MQTIFGSLVRFGWLAIVLPDHISVKCLFSISKIFTCGGFRGCTQHRRLSSPGRAPLGEDNKVYPHTLMVAKLVKMLIAYLRKDALCPRQESKGLDSKQGVRLRCLDLEKVPPPARFDLPTHISNQGTNIGSDTQKKWSSKILIQLI